MYPAPKLLVLYGVYFMYLVHTQCSTLRDPQIVHLLYIFSVYSPFEMVPSSPTFTRAVCRQDLYTHAPFECQVRHFVTIVYTTAGQIPHHKLEPCFIVKSSCIRSLSYSYHQWKPLNFHAASLYHLEVRKLYYIFEVMKKCIVDRKSSCMVFSIKQTDTSYHPIMLVRLNSCCSLYTDNTCRIEADPSQNDARFRSKSKVCVWRTLAESCTLCPALTTARTSSSLAIVSEFRAYTGRNQLSMQR